MYACMCVCAYVCVCVCMYLCVPIAAIMHPPTHQFFLLRSLQALSQLFVALVHLTHSRHKVDDLLRGGSCVCLCLCLCLFTLCIHTCVNRCGIHEKKERIPT